MPGSLPPGAQGPTQNPTELTKPSNTVRVEFSASRFVLWLGALATLWFILSAIADSGNADIARAIAGLLVFGSVLALGPGAIGNAKGLVEGSA